jgi:hypothetical protein
MKNISKLVIAALTLGSSAWITTAQPADGPAPERDRPHPRQAGPPGEAGMAGPRPPLPLLKTLDANGDGVIDADEIAAASAALKKLDKDGNGKLTPDEFLPPRAGGPPNADRKRPHQPDDAPPAPRAAGGKDHPAGPPIFAALDANGDGVIDADEFAKAPDVLKKLDKNGDGKLSLDELPPPRPNEFAKVGGGRGPGGPGGFRGPGGPPSGGDRPLPPRPPPSEE